MKKNLKKKNYQTQIMRTDINLCAYQNINRRFQKYHKLGILEEINTVGGSLHGRKDFKVSEKGLVFLIADGMHPDIYKNLKNFSQSKLFQTFIFPYFERRTLENVQYL